MNKTNIFVTRPSLPPLEEYVPYLEKIWESKWLTNSGPFHEQLENDLAKYLGVKYISLFANGTLALITALQALKIKGEVITTPYSFVATSHALKWNGITPVFVDIDPVSLNIDPNKIEAAITKKTTAILPVHVYGTPCEEGRIKEIADRNNLKVIYDAAHAFNVKKNNISIANYGDLSILSFHATKVFSTIEGGAIISHTPEMKQHIDDLKNFGFRDELTVVAPGINAKMNELQAAFGLLSLKHIDIAIAKRKEISEFYNQNLDGVKGIKTLESDNSVEYNYSYYPIFVVESEYGKSRDELYKLLISNNIYGRRYFYPLISNFKNYNELGSSKVSNLPISNKVAESVICLPIYPNLDLEYVELICSIIKNN